MGRTSDARERMIDAAGDLLHERGYAAVGVAEICTAADVRKGSFYHYFPSKQALTVEVIQATWAAQHPQWETALSDDLEPLDRIKQLLQLQARTQQNAHSTVGTMFGCLFGNLALEMSHDPVVSKAVEVVFDDQLAMVEQTLQDAATAGQIDPAKATPEVARALLAHLEGAVLFAKVSNNPSLLEQLWPVSTSILGVAPTDP